MDSHEKEGFVKGGYSIEVHSLSMIAKSGYLTDLIPSLKVDSSHIARSGTPRVGKDSITNLVMDSGVISAATPSKQLHDVFLNSCLSGCCDLLDGWNFSITELMSEDIVEIVCNKVYADIDNRPKYIEELAGKLHSADTVRVACILRQCGLLELESHNTRQLSLGAASGEKDIQSLHKVPMIYINNNDNTEDTRLNFDVAGIRPEHVVLVDNDKSLRKRYEQYNIMYPDHIHAINDEAYTALDILARKIASGEIDYRNLIIGNRVDHRMIDDIKDFFVKLADIMEPQAAFIISVGSGFSVSEYKGRIELMSIIFDYLYCIGLKPVRIILHAGDSMAENRLQPSFGHPGFATHEVLYCMLEKSALI